VGFCGIFKHFSGFEFFLLPSRIHARPHAGNANRSAADTFVLIAKIKLRDVLYHIPKFLTRLLNKKHGKL
jgi:hypothetical protein